MSTRRLQELEVLNSELLTLRDTSKVYVQLPNSQLYFAENINKVKSGVKEEINKIKSTLLTDLEKSQSYQPVLSIWNTKMIGTSRGLRAKRLYRALNFIMTNPSKKVDLGLLEEDDEFEEFPAEDWADKAEDEQDVNVWEDNWDDDNVEDDFSQQLRAELEKQRFKVNGENAPKAN